MENGFFFIAIAYVNAKLAIFRIHTQFDTAFMDV